MFCNIIQSSIWALLSDKTYIYGYQFSWFAHKRLIFGFIRDWTFNFFFLPVHILFMWSENQFCFLIFGCEHKKSLIFLQILPKFLVEKTAGSYYLFLASFRSKYFLIKFGNNFWFPESMFLRIEKKKYWILNFMYQLTNEIHENWFPMNKRYFTVQTVLLFSWV